VPERLTPNGSPSLPRPTRQRGETVLHYGDMPTQRNLIKLLYRLEPDEIYHLAAQSHVRVSFDIPEYTGMSPGLGTIRIFGGDSRDRTKDKVYQASSSEMYGKVRDTPQSRFTPF